VKLLQVITKIILHAAEIELHLVDALGSDRLIRIAADMRSAKNTIRIIDAHGANQRSAPLIKALAFAHNWRQEMERGVYRTLRALANAKGLSESYVWKVLRLGYLAPDIVEAILDARQPSGLSLNQINATKLSGDWSSQRRTLGFPQIN